MFHFRMLHHQRSFAPLSEGFPRRTASMRNVPCTRPFRRACRAKLLAPLDPSCRGARLASIHCSRETAAPPTWCFSADSKHVVFSPTTPTRLPLDRASVVVFGGGGGGGEYDATRIAGRAGLVLPALPPLQLGVLLPGAKTCTYRLLRRAEHTSLSFAQQSPRKCVREWHHGPLLRAERNEALILTLGVLSSGTASLSSGRGCCEKALGDERSMRVSLFRVPFPRWRQLRHLRTLFAPAALVCHRKRLLKDKDW